MSTLEKAESEMAKGNLWRAKEILQGSISNSGYQCDLFEKLGIVLLVMGDLPESGRFLFLSGRRKPEYEQAIGVFLTKYRKDLRTLFQTFPKAARVSALSDYPERVRMDLAALGFPQVGTGDLRRVKSARPGDHATAVAGWLVVGLILVVMLMGIIKVIEIIRWFV